MKDRRINTPLVIVAFVVLASLAWQPAIATQRLSTDFMPSYEDKGTVLDISGTGVLKYLGFIKIYNGALYLPPEINSDRALEDVPKRLEVKYLRSFKAKYFGPVTIAGIKKNVDLETYRKLETRITYHNTLYEDISTGDRVALTYIPAVGTMVEINGKRKGVIKGADFAEALFSLWLGTKPLDTNFKKALLGAK